MKLKKNTGHSISSLFSLLLFSVFALFLMLMLLFSARVYQQTVKQTDSDSGLGTAITYLTTKFRQHDQADRIFSGSLDDIPALCFRDTLKGKDYITYIYLKDGNLTELFTLRILRQAHRPVLPFLSFRIFRQKTWIMVFTAFP